jgi:putative endonuclease
LLKSQRFRGKIFVNRQQRIGKWGEETVRGFLLMQGHTILAQNVRTPYGEIDLVSQLAEEVFFIEVKSRTSNTFGMPEVSISARKRLHMLQSAEHYMQNHPELGTSWRIDVIAVSGRPGGTKPDLVVFENVCN